MTSPEPIEANHRNLMLEARRLRARRRPWRPLARRDYRVFLSAMAAATGCRHAELDHRVEAYR